MIEYKYQPMEINLDHKTKRHLPFHFRHNSFFEERKVQRKNLQKPKAQKLKIAIPNVKKHTKTEKALTN
jgi:hypothetical protein